MSDSESVSSTPEDELWHHERKPPLSLPWSSDCSLLSSWFICHPREEGPVSVAGGDKVCCCCGGGCGGGWSYLPGAEGAFDSLQAAALYHDPPSLTPPPRSSESTASRTPRAEELLNVHVQCVVRAFYSLSSRDIFTFWIRVICSFHRLHTSHIYYNSPGFVHY